MKCGAAHKKWAGRCDACGEWNSIAEEAPLAAGPSGKTLGASKGRKVALGDLSGIDKGKHVTYLYLISSAIAGVVGILLASEFKSGYSNRGTLMEFDALVIALLAGEDPPG